MSVLHIEDLQEYKQEVLSASGKVVVDFWADWCGPCRMMAPVLEELAEKYPQVKVAKVNVDEVSQPAMQLGIDHIPAFVLFEDGKPVKKVIGAMQMAALAQQLGL